MSYSIEQIAQVAHEANRVFCQSIGDTSQDIWEFSPQWQKASAMRGVLMHIGNPEATPADSHNSWRDEKIAAGWVWGPIKDADAKTHPCMVAYDELPEDQQTKDYLFRAVVHAMAHK